MPVSSDRLSLAVDPRHIRVVRKEWTGKKAALPVAPKRDLSDLGFALITISTAIAVTVSAILFAV